MVTVTGSIQSSQAAQGYTGDPGILLLAAGAVNPAIDLHINPNLPVTIATPTPEPSLNPGIVRNTTITPVNTLNNTSYARITDGFYTNSSLLYVINGGNITVIETDTKKVVDVIYLDKYMLLDAVVTPDYKKLYVLYHDTFDPARVESWEDQDYGNFILTIDLETKQIIDDTWYRDYPDYLAGMANDLVLSPDGRYLYYGNNQMYGAILFEYDTVLHKYTRGVITNGYYGSVKDENSNIYDLTLCRDGKRLYFADTFNGKLTFVNLPDLSLNSWYGTGVADFKPWTAAVSSDGNKAYLAGEQYYGTYYLVMMDLPAIAAKEKNAVSAMKTSILMDRLKLNPDEDFISVIQPDNKRLVQYYVDSPDVTITYKTGNLTDDYIISEDGTVGGGLLYIYSTGNNYVSVYNLYTREEIQGSPIVLGKDWGGDHPWRIGGKHKMVMGPVPQGLIFVNDSAYRANRMLALASAIQAPSTGRLTGALELNKSRGTDSSFYFDPGLGRTVFANMSASSPSATAAPRPGFDLAQPGMVTIRPLPGQPEATPGPLDNQTQNQYQENTSNVTTTPGKIIDTPKPPATSATATPGFEAVISLACLAIATLAVRRKKY